MSISTIIYEECLFIIASSKITYIHLQGKLTINNSGDLYSFKNGKLHSDNDQPAIIWVNGNQCWYQHNKVHRDNDQPALIMSNGDRYWYRNGRLHRDHGPAVIYENGYRLWYQNNIPLWNRLYG